MDIIDVLRDSLGGYSYISVILIIFGVGIFFSGTYGAISASKHTPDYDRADARHTEKKQKIAKRRAQSMQLTALVMMIVGMLMAYLTK